MAVFTGADLKAWRKSLAVSAQDLADSVPCDVTTIFRYESGKLTPDPEAMLRICTILGDETRWYDWMATVFPSYRRMHSDTAKGNLERIILKLYAVTDELQQERAKVFRDASDGSIDDDDTRGRLRSATDELLSAAQALRTMLKTG